MSVEVAAASYLASKLRDAVEERFMGDVIARWSRRRADAFVDAFSRGLAEEWSVESTVGEADKRLRKILADEQASQHLFEGYRRVVLARSREIGPRVIAAVIARLVVEQREAGWLEETILDIAEKLDDPDFEEICRTAHQSRQDDGSKTEIRWEIDSQSIDTAWHHTGRFQLGPADLTDLGRWAVVLRDAGLLHEELTETYRRYEADSERHIDEPGELRTVIRAIVISSRIHQIAEVVDLAKRLRDSSKSK